LDAEHTLRIKVQSIAYIRGIDGGKNSIIFHHRDDGTTEIQLKEFEERLTDDLARWLEVNLGPPLSAEQLVGDGYTKFVQSARLGSDRVRAICSRETFLVFREFLDHRFHFEVLRGTRMPTPAGEVEINIRAFASE
jgi:hypothetical protein